MKKEFELWRLTQKGGCIPCAVFSSMRKAQSVKKEWEEKDPSVSIIINVREE